MPNPEDMLTPTSPTDCALLVAMPLSFEEFESDVKVWPERGDYARSLASNVDCAADAWNRLGHGVADLGLDLISLANNLGVNVFSRATLSDITRAASDHKVLIIVGHFKGPKLEAADLLVNPTVFCGFVERANSRVGREISARIMQRMSKEILDSPIATQRKLLASIINENIIDTERPLGVEWQTANSIARDPLWESCYAREALEEAFPGCLRPGNALELRDGYHQYQAVRNCFPKDWTGIIEFSICFSLYFAEKIKNNVSDRRIIVNKKEKLPDRCIRELIETFVLISTNEMNYARARASVFKEYSKLVKNN